MAPHSSPLAWRIPWTEEPGGYSPWGQESDMTELLHFHFSLSCPGQGYRDPLQSSCLENPRDGRGWWAVFYGVAQSRTRLTRLSSSTSSSLVLSFGPDHKGDRNESHKCWSLEKHLFFGSLRGQACWKELCCDLSDHRKDKSPVLAGLIDRSPERTNCHPRDTGVPGHLFHGRWSLPTWHGKLASWTLCCFPSWLKGNTISAHPDTHAPEARHLCEDIGSNHIHNKKQAWSISPETGARWAQDHELLQLTWGLLLMGALSISLRPQPTLCLNHCWHWPIPRRTGESHPDSGIVRAKYTQRKQGYAILKIWSILSRLYTCIYVLQIEYIFKNIYGTFEIWLQSRSPKWFLCVCVWLCCMACGILFPWPGMELSSPALEAQRLNHWTGSPKKDFWIAESHSHTDFHSEAIMQ